MGLKKVEATVEDFLPKAYVKASKRDSKKTDYFCVESDWRKNYVKDNFWYSGKFLKVCYQDVMSEEIKRQTRKQICEEFNIPIDGKIIIYAPTFRDSYDQIDFRYNDLFKGLIKDDSTYVIVRFHPNNRAKMKNVVTYSEHIFDGNLCSNAEDLIAAADLFLTDYSSTSFICYRNGVKCMIYAPDVEHYEKTERGFNFDLREMPGRLSTSVEELFENIENLDVNEYEKRVNDLNDSLGYYFDKVNLEEVFRILEN